MRRLVISLIIQLALWMAIECITGPEWVLVASYWQHMCSLTIALQEAIRMQGRRPRRLWAHERGLNESGFFDQNLLGSFNAREFKSRMRMDVSTFEYLCSTLSSMLLRHDTNMCSAIPVQVKVAVSISRLATCNSMQCIADLYMIGLSSSQLAVSLFCGAVKSMLLRKFIWWPSTAVMDKFADEFSAIHQIPYVVGVVDGSHIPIIAPRLHAADYYNRKGFHSILLQGVVSSKCLFWDFDIGWAGSMHNANLWARTDIGQFCEAGRLSPYVLVGDVAYPCRPWMLAPKPLPGPQRWVISGRVPLELYPELNPYVRGAGFWDA